jgi:hypothetical protein
VVTGDPLARVRELKSDPGAGVWLAGGGSLAGRLYDEIDELVLKVAPITIGAGVPSSAAPTRPCGCVIGLRTHRRACPAGLHPVLPAPGLTSRCAGRFTVVP